MLKRFGLSGLIFGVAYIAIRYALDPPARLDIALIYPALLCGAAGLIVGSVKIGLYRLGRSPWTEAEYRRLVRLIGFLSPGIIFVSAASPLIGAALGLDIGDWPLFAFVTLIVAYLAVSIFGAGLIGFLRSIESERTGYREAERQERKPPSES